MTADAEIAIRDDARLVQALLAGAPGAVHELSARFGPKLHWYAASRLGGDAHLAEDVMLESLVDAVRNIRYFNARSSTLAAWMYGITRRKVQGELRRQHRQKSPPRSAQRPLTEAAEVASRDMAEAVTSRLEAQRQVSALAQVLTEVEFEVLVLTCIEELSAREVGHALGRSERAIHSILHRARTKARERLLDNE